MQIVLLVELWCVCVFNLWPWCRGVVQSEKEKLEASDRQLKKMQKRLREEELKLLRGEQVRPQAPITHPDFRKVAGFPCAVDRGTQQHGRRMALYKVKSEKASWSNQMRNAVGVCCVQDLKEQDGEVVSSGKKHEHHKGSKAAAAK